MKTRILAAFVGVPLLLLSIFFLPVWIFAILIGGVTAVIAWELCSATKVAPNARARTYALIFAAAIPILAGLYDLIPNHGLLFYSPIAPILLLALLLAGELVLCYGTKKALKLSDFLVLLLAGGIIPTFFSHLVLLNLTFGHQYYLLLPFLIAFVSDAGAYFTGGVFGKQKLIERVSPNKTRAGAVGGLVLCTVGVAAFAVTAHLVDGAGLNIPAIFLYGIVGSVIVQLGDLVFSAIKREYHVKDFGTLIPGHGGMLDRFDSMILLAPFVSIMLGYFPLFG